MIELIADGGRASFFVHKDLLASQSEFRRTNTNRAVNGKFDLEAWDGETVGYFVDFLYLRGYNVENQEPLCPAAGSPEGTVSDTTEETSRSDTPDTIQPDSSQDPTHPRPLTPIQSLLDSFNAEDHGSLPRVDLGHADHGLHRLASHDYRGFMFAHAKVYALAQSLGIDELQRMAYRSLAGVLAGFESTVEGSVLATSSIEIMRYIYSKCHGPGDPMRNLVTQFAALNFLALQRIDRMKEVVSEGGELAVDLVAKLCRRLVATEDDLRCSRERYAQEMLKNLSERGVPVPNRWRCDDDELPPVRPPPPPPPPEWRGNWP